MFERERALEGDVSGWGVPDGTAGLKPRLENHLHQHVRVAFYVCSEASASVLCTGQPEWEKMLRISLSPVMTPHRTIPP